MSIFLAMIDGLSLNYHNKSYQKLINNLKKIIDFKMKIYNLYEYFENDLDKK